MRADFDPLYRMGRLTAEFGAAYCRGQLPTDTYVHQRLGQEPRMGELCKRCGTLTHCCYSGQAEGQREQATRPINWNHSGTKLYLVKALSVWLDRPIRSPVSCKLHDRLIAIPP